MAISYNPGIVTDGLVFSLDSKNPRTSNRRTSEIDISTWEVGTSAPSGFSFNGDGNSLLVDTNPWGYEDIVWDVSNQDAASDADGGWNGTTFAIDNTKMYRFSTWVRRKTVGNGHFYIGCHGYNTGVNEGVLTRSGGASTTNPYFEVNTNWAAWTENAANTWYLAVAHVWPSGSGTGSDHADTAVYKQDGTVVDTSIEDFVWKTTNNQSLLRTYLYYSTNTSTNQQWYHPRVDIVDGTEPSIDDLRNDYMNWLDGTRRTPNVTLQEAVLGANGFEFTADNDDSSISVPLASALNKDAGTIECWINPTSYATSNGIFINRDVPTANSLDWLWIGSWSSGSTLYLRIGDGTSATANDLTLSTFSTFAPTSTWTHLACTWLENGSSYIYINGAQEATTSIGTIANTSPSTTGRIGLGHDSGTTGSWNGKIDQFKIYNRQLSGVEILNNYKATKARYGL